MKLITRSIFIHGNLCHVQQYAHDLLDFIQLYQAHYPNPCSDIKSEAEDIDLAFIQADLPKSLESMAMGTNRIRQIVLSLRNFSRMDEAEFKAVDIHDGIESTLLILQHRLLNSSRQAPIQIIRDYDEIPLIDCYPGPHESSFNEHLVQRN